MTGSITRRTGMIKLSGHINIVTMIPYISKFKEVGRRSGTSEWERKLTHQSRLLALRRPRTVSYSCVFPSPHTLIPSAVPLIKKCTWNGFINTPYDK